MTERDPDPLFAALRERLGAHERAPSPATWAALTQQLAARRRRRAGWLGGSALLLLLLLTWGGLRYRTTILAPPAALVPPTGRVATQPAPTAGRRTALASPTAARPATGQRTADAIRGKSEMASAHRFRHPPKVAIVVSAPLS